MKIEVTEAQLKAIKSMADDMSAMLGCGDNDKIWAKNIKMIDNLLAKNKLAPRDFK